MTTEFCDLCNKDLPEGDKPLETKRGGKLCSTCYGTCPHCDRNDCPGMDDDVNTCDFTEPEGETDMKKTVQVTLAPHLQGEEVQKRLAEAVERRNMADYECFQLLRDMADNGLLARGGFLALLKNDESMTDDEKLDLANHYEREVIAKLRERREADMQWTMAMRGNS